MLMKNSIKVLLLPLFLICIQNAYSLEAPVSKLDVEAYAGGNFTRGSQFMCEIAGICSVELNDTLGFRGGLSVGRTMIDTDINALVNIYYSPFENLPLSFSVAYIYNGLPEYEAHTSSIIPFVSFNARIAGIMLGMNFRFSSHFGESAQFETVLSFYGYFNFINNDRIRIGIGAGNLKDFHSNNMGAISMNLFAELPIAENLIFLNDVEYMQSGMDGLTATLFKISFHTGVKISW